MLLMLMVCLHHSSVGYTNEAFLESCEFSGTLANQQCKPNERKIFFNELGQYLDNSPRKISEEFDVIFKM